MATSKTLAPTNVTISIPAMTDAPNASVLANCADKEADAINALNSQIGNMAKALYVYYAPSSGATANTAIDITDAVTIPSGATVRSVAVQCIYGGSSVDYNATVIYNPTNSHFVLMPTITQTPIRANFTVFYTT